MILFLDFDGVLHPNNRPGALFMWVPRLAMWLADWPGVEVVISSSWRAVHSLHEMVKLLGPGVGSRVVGCTPLLRQEVPEWRVYPKVPTGATARKSYGRQAEIDAWLAMSWQPKRPWVALDDMPSLFELDCAWLVSCNGHAGLSGENLVQLSAHARRAGLVSSERSLQDMAGLNLPDADPSGRMLTIEKYLKHSMSCLPDAMFRITIDVEKRVVTIASQDFDSSLIGWLVTQILPEQHGIKVYREDDAGWHPPRPTYDLRVRIGGEGGIEMDAEVVRLSSAVGGGLAVHLRDPQVLGAPAAGPGTASGKTGQET